MAEAQPNASAAPPSAIQELAVGEDIHSDFDGDGVVERRPHSMTVDMDGDGSPDRLVVHDDAVTIGSQKLRFSDVGDIARVFVVDFHIAKPGKQLLLVSRGISEGDEALLYLFDDTFKKAGTFFPYRDDVQLEDGILTVKSGSCEMIKASKDPTEESARYRVWESTFALRDGKLTKSSSRIIEEYVAGGCSD